MVETMRKKKILTSAGRNKGSFHHGHVGPGHISRIHYVGLLGVSRAWQTWPCASMLGVCPTHAHSTSFQTLPCSLGTIGPAYDLNQTCTMKMKYCPVRKCSVTPKAQMFLKMLLSAGSGLYLRALSFSISYKINNKAVME